MTKTVFEATIFEYEDCYSLGTFATEAAAYEAIGRHIVEHGDIQFPRPRVTKR